MRIQGPLLLLLLAACGQEPAPPDGLLSRDTFKEVLLEAQLIEARVSQELVIGPQGPGHVDSLYAALFRSKGVTQEAFTATFDQYASRPRELKAVYEEILNELTTRKDRPAQ
jgi:hypothetical protein